MKSLPLWRCATLVFLLAIVLSAFLSTSASAQSLSNLILYPPSVVGGTAVAGTVNLTSAPSAPLTVALSKSSNGNGVVGIPANVVVPAGQNYAYFTVTTYAVASSVTPTITASYNGGSVNSTVTVTPPTPQSLILSPAQTVGGNQMAITINLTGPAPTGGTSWTLQSSDHCVQPQTNGTIPAGSTYMYATCTTTPVAVNHNVTITLNLTSGGTGSATGSVTITPPSVDSLLLYPNPQYSGWNEAVTINLNGPAPAGGTAWTLTSTDGNVQPQASGTIPAGALYAYVPCSTLPVTTNHTATISLTLGAGGSGTASGTLTILPAAFNTFGLSTGSVQGGHTLTGDVTLYGTSASATPVTITCSNPSLAWVSGQPANVTIPANSSNGYFTIVTGPTSTTQVVTLTATCGTASASVKLTITPTVPPTGYFQLGLNSTNHPCFIDKNGNPFYLRGVHGVRMPTDSTGTPNPLSTPQQPSYIGPYTWYILTYLGETRTAWDTTAVNNLKNWGFNTVGGYSDSNPESNSPGGYIHILDLAKVTNAPLADFWSTAWASSVDTACKNVCAVDATDKKLIGYCTDNELNWTGYQGTTLANYLALPTTAPGYIQASNYVATHPITQTFNANAQARGFLALVAKQYFQVTHDTIRTYDTNHLILGCRFSTDSLQKKAPEMDAVMSSIGNNVDVVSTNYYAYSAQSAVDHIALVTRKPVIVTEFTIMNNGTTIGGQGGEINNTLYGTTANYVYSVSNFFGASGATAQATDITNYTTELINDDNCLGYTWFKYDCQPPTTWGGAGNAAGEAWYCGLVDPTDVGISAVDTAFTNAGSLAHTNRE